MNLVLTAVSFGAMLVLLFTSFIIYPNAGDAAERRGFKGNALLRGMNTRSNLTKAIAATGETDEQARLEAHLRRTSVAQFVLFPSAAILCAIAVYFSLRL